jgi:hypothetical protein
MVFKSNFISSARRFIFDKSKLPSSLLFTKKQHLISIVEAEANYFMRTVEMDQKDDIKNLELKHYDDIKNLEMNQKDVIKNLELNQKDVISKMKFKERELELDISLLTSWYLRMNNRLTVRGALEHIRYLYASKEIPKKNSYSINDKQDVTLQALSNENDVIEALEASSEANRIRPNDMKKCVAGLYHSSSKHYHGVVSEYVTIDERDYTPSEVISLAVLFSIYHIEFDYVNTQGVYEMFPYKILFIKKGTEIKTYIRYNPAGYGKRFNVKLSNAQ